MPSRRDCALQFDTLETRDVPDAVGIADSFDAMSSTRTYRPPLPLETVLRERAAAVGARDGAVDFQFATRDEANEAIDLLRRENCAIESLVQTSSTLEDVFVQTIGNGTPAAAPPAAGQEVTA